MLASKAEDICERDTLDEGTKGLGSNPLGKALDFGLWFDKWELERQIGLSHLWVERTNSSA